MLLIPVNCYLQVDHWLEFSAQRVCGQPSLAGALAELDKALSLRTFLVGHAVTLADLSVWAALKGFYLSVGNMGLLYFNEQNGELQVVFCFFSSCTGHPGWPSEGKSFSHVNRWFFFLSSQVPFTAVGNKYAKIKAPSKSNVSFFRLRMTLSINFWSLTE